jgi:hypothetical protein
MTYGREMRDTKKAVRERVKLPTLRSGFEFYMAAVLKFT